MSQKKKVFLSLSDGEWDCLSKTAERRSESVDEVVSEAVKKQIAADRAKALKNGYEEMAQINLSLAEACLTSDEQALSEYEEKLTECE